MNKLLGFAFILLVCICAFSQGIIGNGLIQYVWSAPSGACGQNSQQQDVVGSGNVYTCQSGTWTQVGASASSGALVQLETHAASASSELDFTGCINNGSYHTFWVNYYSVILATDANALNLQVSTNGGSSYDATSVYSSNPNYASVTQSDAGGTAARQTSVTAAYIAGPPGNIKNTDAGYSINGNFYIYAPASSALYKTFKFAATAWWNGTPNFYEMDGGAIWKSTSAINAFRVLANSGNITSGTVTCYGVTP